MPKMVADEFILEAALATIVTHGYDGATTRLIAAAANINEVTLFRKFGSKDKLVVLAVKQELAAFREADIVYSGELQADLEQMVRFYSMLFSQRAKLIPLILSEVPRRPELRAGLSELATIAQDLAAIIARYQAQGRLCPALPFQTLMTLLAPVLAHHLTQSLDLAVYAPFDSAEYVRVFLHGHATLLTS